jgi:type II secretory pathway predicted ATPase ExeA
MLAEVSPQDKAEYVHYRLQSVGGKHEVFAVDALTLLHEATRGRLWDVVRICTEVLTQFAL